MDSCQPITHLDMAVLKDRADLDGEFFSAGIALVEAWAVTIPARRPERSKTPQCGHMRPLAQTRVST